LHSNKSYFNNTGLVEIVFCLNDCDDDDGDPIINEFYFDNFFFVSDFLLDNEW